MAGAQPSYRPYKFGLVALGVMVPLVMAGAARGFGVSAQATIWTALCSCGLWWTQSYATPIANGQALFYMMGLNTILFLSGLVRYARQPGVTAWLMMALPSILGWFLHPIYWLGVAPIVAVYYLVNAPRFGLAWHLGACCILLFGLGINLWWLPNWLDCWWVRYGSDAPMSLCWAELFHLPSLVEPVTQTVYWPLYLLAGIGVILLARRHRRGAVGVLLGTAIVCCIANRLGHVSESAKLEGLARMSHLLPLLALLPASYALCQTFRSMKIFPIMTTLVSFALCLGCWMELPYPWLQRWIPKVNEFDVGFTPAQKQFLDRLELETTDTARILLEDRPQRPDSSQWEALLARSTGRIIMGGIDPNHVLEHSRCCYRDGHIGTKPLTEWTEVELQQYFNRYNIGWIVSRTPSSREYWLQQPCVRWIADQPGPTPSWSLFSINREHSYFLRGSGTIARQDCGRIVLTDLVPDTDGKVVLSLHYQKHFRAGPMVLKVEPEFDVHDPIPFLALTVPGGATRVNVMTNPFWN
jgi:hypothetical protein